MKWCHLQCVKGNPRLRVWLLVLALISDRGRRSLPADEFKWVSSRETRNLANVPWWSYFWLLRDVKLNGDAGGLKWGFERLSCRIIEETTVNPVIRRDSLSSKQHRHCDLDRFEENLSLNAIAEKPEETKNYFWVKTHSGSWAAESFDAAAYAIFLSSFSAKTVFTFRARLPWYFFQFQFYVEREKIDQWIFHAVKSFLIYYDQRWSVNSGKFHAAAN